MINSSFNLGDSHSVTQSLASTFSQLFIMTVFTSNHLDFTFCLPGINPIKKDRVVETLDFKGFQNFLFF